MLFLAAAIGSIAGLLIAYKIDQIHQRKVMRDLGLATQQEGG